MKKILLSLLVLVSFSYASPTNFYYPNTAGGLPVFLVYEGKNYRLGNGVIETEPHTSCSGISDSAPDEQMSFNGSFVYYRKGSYRYSDRWVSNARCILAYGYYNPIPACPEGQALDPIFGCSSVQCSKGSHLNADNKCEGDYPIKGVQTFDDGSKLIMFEDGASMFCRPNFECYTVTSKNEATPNRYYAGSIPSEITALGTIADWLLTKTGNAIGGVLQVAGMTIVSNGTLGGALIYEGGEPTLNALNPAFTAGSGLIALGNALVTPEKVWVSAPTPDNAIHVDIVESTSSVNFSSFDVETPSTGEKVFSENGVYTQQQITEAGLKTIWDTAGGVGTMPPNALILGSDIIYPSKNPDKAIIDAPDKYVVVETKPDKSATVTEINKADLDNALKNKTDLTYAQTQYDPPKINSDGTTSQTQTQTQGIVKGNNENQKTDTGGTTIIGDPTKGTPTSNSTIIGNGGSGGGSMDLSGVTSRLDKISNQLTKQNDRNDLIDKAVVSDVQHGIPSVPSSWDSWETTWNNIRSDMDNVIKQADDLKSFIDGQPLSLNLAKGGLNTCPYDYTLDYFANSVSVSLDLCKAVSPARSVFYFIIYFGLVGSSIFFSFKTIFRMF